MKRKVWNRLMVGDIVKIEYAESIGCGNNALVELLEYSQEGKLTTVVVRTVIPRHGSVRLRFNNPRSLSLAPDALRMNYQLLVEARPLPPEIEDAEQ